MKQATQKKNSIAKAEKATNNKENKDNAVEKNSNSEADEKNKYALDIKVKSSSMA